MEEGESKFYSFFLVLDWQMKTIHKDCWGTPNIPTGSHVSWIFLPGGILKSTCLTTGGVENNPLSSRVSDHTYKSVWFCQVKRFTPNKESLQIDLKESLQIDLKDLRQAIYSCCSKADDVLYDPISCWASPCTPLYSVRIQWCLLEQDSWE